MSHRLRQKVISLCSLQLCKAGLKTLQDLGPEMRLALNEDLEDEEEALMDSDDLEKNAAYKVPTRPRSTAGSLTSRLKLPVLCLQAENGFGPETRRGSILTPTGKMQLNLPSLLPSSSSLIEPQILKIRPSMTFNLKKGNDQILAISFNLSMNSRGQ